MNHDKIIKNLFVLFCFLQVADIATTYYSLYYLGLHEYNPGIKALMETAGIMTALMIIKVIGVLLTGFMLYFMIKRDKRYGTLAISICCLLYVGVIGNNIYWIFLSPM